MNSAIEAEAPTMAAAGNASATSDSVSSFKSSAALNHAGPSSYYHD